MPANCQLMNLATRLNHISLRMSMRSKPSLSQTSSSNDCCRARLTLKSSLKNWSQLGMLSVSTNLKRSWWLSTQTLWTTSTRSCTSSSSFKPTKSLIRLWMAMAVTIKASSTNHWAGLMSKQSVSLMSSRISSRQAAHLASTKIQCC